MKIKKEFIEQRIIYRVHIEWHSYSIIKVKWYYCEVYLFERFNKQLRVTKFVNLKQKKHLRMIYIK